MKKLLLGSLTAIGLSITAPLVAHAQPANLPEGYTASYNPISGNFCYSSPGASIFYCYNRALNPNRVSRSFGMNAVVIGPGGEQYGSNSYYNPSYGANSYDNNPNNTYGGPNGSTVSAVPIRGNYCYSTLANATNQYYNTANQYYCYVQPLTNDQIRQTFGTTSVQVVGPTGYSSNYNQDGAAGTLNRVFDGLNNLFNQ